MYDLPSRSDVGTVVITEDVIAGNAEPQYLPERRQAKAVKDTSADLKVIDSKSA